MPKIEYSFRFADDLSQITLQRIEDEVFSILDHLRMFGEFGSPNVPDSIKQQFGSQVRKVAINPFDLIYSYYPDLDLVRVEALIYQRVIQ